MSAVADTIPMAIQLLLKLFREGIVEIPGSGSNDVKRRTVVRRERDAFSDSEWEVGLRRTDVSTRSASVQMRGQVDDYEEESGIEQRGSSTPEK